jgi:hypothetical protein
MLFHSGKLRFCFSFEYINKSAWGNMTVAGLAGTTNLQHIGRTGNINFGGAAASNYIYRRG